jgi:hypothetical protein
MMTCAEFAEILMRAAAKAETGLAVPTEELMKDVQEKAKEAIGTYAYGWPELAESTQESRTQLGFSANDPLLRTGALQGSIASKAEGTGLGAEGLVYSGEKTALWAELGTSRGEPPRSFLMQSLLRSIPEAGAIFARFAEGLFR